MTTDREDVARRLAERLGWTPVRCNGRPYAGFEFLNDEGDDYIFVPFPPPDAPLHEHLAFCGRVIEAAGALAFIIGRYPDGFQVKMRFPDCESGHQPDLSLAAARAILGDDHGDSD